MSKRKIPSVILRRAILVAGFAMICTVIGIAAACSGDKSLTILSMLVAVGCLFQVISDCMAAKKGKILVLEGLGKDVSTAFRRFKEVSLEDRNGNEHKLRLQRNVRVIPGETYRFYFRDTATSRVGVEYVDTLLSVGNFLGVEGAISNNEPN